MKNILSVLLICIGIFTCTAQEVYMFSYFKGNGEDGLHLAYSEDALHWKALNNDKAVEAPHIGEQKLMRDPCIIRGGDGNFHMVWTTGWTERGIGYASSPDLIHWSGQKLLFVMHEEATARNCWAPEITYDAKTGAYMIYWATTIPGKFPETQSDMDSGYNHRMYYTVTKDFKKFTPTKLLYEPGFNVIDATIQQEGDQYIMFLKDETREPAKKNIRIAYADQLTGPYSEAGEPITGKYWAEGPTALKKDGSYIVYFDKYTEHKYGAVTSKDLKNWEDISAQIEFPKGTRHGTVFTVTEEEFKKMQQEFSATN